MNSYWLVYHPKRERLSEDINIYHDSFSGNQDPYIWNKKFLHSYCHMTELNQVKEGDTIFWISSDDLNNPQEIMCDLVFKIEKIVQWEYINPDRAEEMNQVLNQFKSDLSNIQLAYENHFRWYFDGNHAYNEIKSNGYRSNFTRKTFIAREDSYQPQDRNGELLNIINILKENIDLNKLKHPSGRGSFRTEICIHLARELEKYFDCAGNKKYGRTFFEYKDSILSDDNYTSKLKKYYSGRKEYISKRKGYINKLKDENKKIEYSKKYSESVDYYLQDIK